MECLLVGYAEALGSSPIITQKKKRSQFCFCFCFSVFKTKPYCVEQADLKLLSLPWPSSSEIISMNHDQPSEDHQNGEV